jgi:hypothetical protein
MKTNLLFFSLIVVFTSCKKDMVCTCTTTSVYSNTYNGTTTTSTSTSTSIRYLKKVSKSDANAACSGGTDNYSDNSGSSNSSSTGCTLN